MNNNRSKVAIIGAGFVGASTAFALAMKQLVNEMVIIDVDRNKAAGGNGYQSRAAVYRADEYL